MLHAQITCIAPECNCVNVGEPTFLIGQKGESFDVIQQKPFSSGFDEVLEVFAQFSRVPEIWYRFKLENNCNEALRLGVCTPQEAAHFRWFTVREGQTDSLSGGMLQFNDSLAYLERNGVELKLAAGERVEIFLGIRHYVRAIPISNFNVIIQSPEQYTRSVVGNTTYSRSMVYLLSFFCGLLIFQFLYVLIQWYLVRRIEYFYYAAYIVALCFYFFYRTAIQANLPMPFNLSWSGVYWFNDVMLVLPAFFYFGFVRYFADLPVHSPIANKRIRNFQIIILVLSALVFVNNSALNFPLISKGLLLLIASLLQFAMVVFTFIWLLRVDRKSVRFLLVGSVILTVAHIVAMLLSFLLSLNIQLSLLISPLSTTIIGLILEIAVFNSGLLFKARDIEREKSLTQRQLIRELQEREKIQNEYNAVRDKIASDLHDDIGSILSSIGIYSYAAQSKLRMGDLAKSQELLNSIEKSAKDTILGMEDLIWSINPQNDSMERLFERVKSFAVNILGAKGIAINWQVSDEVYTWHFNQQQRRNLLLLLKEGINNAAKYSSAEEVTLAVRPYQGRYELILEDNGVGFNIDSVASGNGLRTMRRRAAELGADLVITSQPGHTRLSLVL